MTDQLFVWVCRWEDFQHYLPKRDRGPVWIKDYTAQLDDDRYLSLNAHQRAVLHDIRIAFASARGKLPKDTRKLSNKLSIRVTKPTLEALNDAGFVEFLSREVLDNRLEKLYSRSRSKSKKKRKINPRAVPVLDTGSAPNPRERLRIAKTIEESLAEAAQ